MLFSADDKLMCRKVTGHCCLLSCAVSNAGMGLIGPIECQTIDEMKTVMDTNFFGLVRLLKEILPDMKKRKSGHIVIISSVMGIQGKVVVLFSLFLEFSIQNLRRNS